MLLPRLDWLGVIAVLLLASCGDPGTGPTEIKWDRETCERCRMVLSDRNHSAQVRHLDETGRSRVHGFDDIGCAVIWLRDKPWRDAPSTEIWVTDWRSGDWIDARSASYVAGQVTPMEYGLGAQRDAAAHTLSFDQAIKHIFDVERKYNVHGGHLDAAPTTR